MPVPFEGGCRCGAVRYQVSAEPIAVMDCHCRDCQYASGGSHTTAVVVPAAAFKITKGMPKRFFTVGDSGQQAARGFCDNCGTPLFSEPPGGQIWVVKAGTLDDPSWLTIGGAIYVRSAQPWAPIDPSKLRFERMPPGAPGVQ